MARTRSVNTPTRVGTRNGQPVWRIRWRFGGELQSINVVTTSTKNRAVSAIEELGCDISSEDSRVTSGQLWGAPTASGLSFGQVATEYVSAKVRATPRTRRRTEELITRRMGALTGVPIGQLTAAAVNSWTSRELDAGMAPQSVRVQLGIIGGVLAFAHRRGYRPDNPSRDIIKPKVPAKRQLITTTQLGAVMAHTTEARWAELWSVLSETGLRIGEARALHVADVHLDGTPDDDQPFLMVTGSTIGGNSQEIGPGKTGEPRRVDLWPSTVATLRPLVDGRDGAELVWHGRFGATEVISYEPIRVAWAKAVAAAVAAGSDIDPKTRIHGLRHYHLSDLANSSVPLNVVQDRAGHASILTTQGYVQTNAAGRSALMAHGATRKPARRLSAV